MRTPASIAQHPIHPMLVVFPIGLWIFSLICDVISTGASTPATWQTVAFYTMVGGTVGALCAAIPGLVDLVSLKAVPSVQKLAVAHMVINLVAVVLYIINIWIRSGHPTNMKAPLTLSIVGVVLIAVSGWIGGQMVHVHGVGVSTRE